MSKLIVLSAIAIIAYVLYKYLGGLSPQQRKQHAVKIALWSAAAILLVLALTGRLHVLTAVGAGLLLFVKRLIPFARYLPMLGGLFKQVSAKNQTAQSRLNTSLLSMTLDHTSGVLDGQVMKGNLQGSWLSELNQPTVISLYALAQSEFPDSVQVLAAYLDRTFGLAWRDAHQSNNQGHASHTTGAMNTQEAHAVLGLQEGADRAQIIAAHRKLIQKLHPDRGGNDYLAAKVNQAKDVLLKDNK